MYKKNLSSFLTFLIILITNYVVATETTNILVDNFESSVSTNRLGGKTGVFQGSTGGWCQSSLYNQDMKNVYGGSGHSLFLAWDVTKIGDFSGYWSDLKHQDLSGYNYLTFLIKGNSGGEVLKVGLRGALDSKYETKILVHDILKNGVTKEWQKVVIPLTLFKAVDNWSDVNMLSFNFENSFNSGRGIIYVDEIRFEK